ncbi:ABC transporter substrate-binding protein [Kutzneria kofuensis]|uniref:NitT/TauT family transport system substrate-binding protein n=1 Tax=Kutzneria kofuensis TaxID=103725 RepID=A0A7W9NJS1_9PSEU|nr:ABC transporter substrate-binding protein [Kutzneria kofuensis]MBB5895927.1 NitT/TauT family transport system substrate-binding protein [Kutzneria kofuensis]
MRRLLPVAAAALLLAGCTAAATENELRLGYLGNLTHATAIVGVAGGFFAKALGDIQLTTQVFNAGPAEMTALLGGQLDAAYVGPSSALNGYVRSHGQALKIVAGATMGGAELVVRPSITAAGQLKGKTLATPQLGNTQDVALRYWLSQHGMRTTTDGGDVAIRPQDNATTLDQFRAGKIDGAWLPEPWASRLVVAAQAKVLVDERDLWPDGRFASTDLVVSTTFLRDHPQAVRRLIDGELAANDWVSANAGEATRTVNTELRRISGAALTDAEVTRAWDEQQVTGDPLASTVGVQADHAVTVGLMSATDLRGIVDIGPLNDALAAKGRPKVDDAGLGDKR